VALTPRLGDWAVRLERYVRDRWTANVFSATSVDLSTILTPLDVRETVEAALRWNTSLIRDVSDQARRRIANSVFAGLQRRPPAREIARELREAVDMGRRRSLLIATDQTQKLAARLDQARQEQAGISGYIWRHSGKAHPRPEHVARNGRTYQWSKPPADGHPGTQPYCGCRAQAVIDPD
jgi:SPP1 gp7 family putative phage head morphogenesis protein